ncbi:hypothetical protein FO519_002264 [Halicephalobus sp. NKZ332]|nr:hypothetical protein FO519_002264 [Halicephalobus sp. NKZ332]
MNRALLVLLFLAVLLAITTAQFYGGYGGYGRGYGGYGRGGYGGYGRGGYGGYGRGYGMYGGGMPFFG